MTSLVRRLVEDLANALGVPPLDYDSPSYPPTDLERIQQMRQVIVALQRLTPEGVA